MLHIRLFQQSRKQSSCRKSGKPILTLSLKLGSRPMSDFHLRASQTDKTNRHTPLSAALHTFSPAQTFLFQHPNNNTSRRTDRSARSVYGTFSSAVLSAPAVPPTADLNASNPPALPATTKPRQASPPAVQAHARAERGGKGEWVGGECASVSPSRRLFLVGQGGHENPRDPRRACLRFF